MVIEIREHPGWAEARCPCGRETVVIAGPGVTAEEIRAGLEQLTGHARGCTAAADDYRAPDPAAAKLVARLMSERYPTLNFRKDQYS